MNWQEIWNDILTMEPGMLEIALRLACAMLIGLVIGTEREYTHRPAGMRTHILVALGACAVSITGELLFNQYSAMGALPDPARLSAQVVTGVGFLGAGTIMREGFSVKGLTTAASLWAVACLGIAAGFGYYALAIFGMVFILITLTFFEWLQDKIIKSHTKRKNYILVTKDIAKSLSLIYEMAREERGELVDMEAVETEAGHRLTFRVDFNGRHKKQHQQRFFNALVRSEATVSMEYQQETVEV